MAALGGIYTTGTVSIAVDGVTVTGLGTLWSMQIQNGDWLLIGGQVGLIQTVSDDTHMLLQSPWQGAPPSASPYVLIKMSWLRYDPALTQQKLRELLASIAAQGTFIFTAVAPPDPALGQDGQWALMTTVAPWKLWYKTGGVWVLQVNPTAGDTIFSESSGLVGIAGTAPLNQFDIVSATNSTSRGVAASQYSDDTFSANLLMRKARGAPALPAAVLKGDELGRIRIEGYDGAAFGAGRALVARAMADWSSADHAMQTTLGCVPAGTTTAVEVLFVHSSRNVTIGTDQDIGDTLTVNRNTATPPTAGSGSVVQFVGADNLPARLSATAFGNNAVMELRRANGTLGTLAAIAAAGLVLGQFSGNGFDGVGWGTTRAAALSMRSQQPWTPTAHGAAAVIEYTPSNSVAITDHTTFDDIGISTVADVYLKNTKRIYGRNAAGLAWLEILRLSSSDLCQVGFGAAGVNIAPPATFGSTVTLFADPAAPLQPATKQYVDNLLGGTGTLNTVRVVDLLNSNPATDYVPGASIDGVTLAAGDRVLRAAALNPARNGPWLVPASGAATRPSDKSTWVQLRGVSITVQEGTVNHDTIWLCTADGLLTLGTDPLGFSAIVSSASRDLLDDTSIAAMRTTLGLTVGVNVQAWSGVLDSFAAQVTYNGTSNKFILNTRYALNRNATASDIESSLAPIGEAIFRTTEADGVVSMWQGVSYGASTGLSVRAFQARGSITVPTKALAGDTPVIIASYPYDGSAFPSAATARIRLETSQDQSPTAKGSQFSVWVTPNDSITLAQALLIQNDSTLMAAAGIRSQSPTAGVGYAPGAGGSVVQATDKTTGVTLNKTSGQITMNAASLANGTTVSFVVTNSAVLATDTVSVNISGGIATAGTYAVTPAVANGSFTISVRNQSAAPLAEAIQLTFNVMKGSIV